MVSLLLAIIYLAFISLGLPDSLLGSGWPVMHLELGAPLSYAGWITMIVSVSTICSSLLSDRVTRKFGTGAVISVSVLLTASAMMAFSFADKFWILCIVAVPYGLGAGAIDAALNNYVALHYSSKHMSWLHCCWGIGATVSPYIMSAALSRSLGWQGGYRIVSIIQFVLTLIMFSSIPLWKKCAALTAQNKDDVASVRLTIPQVFKLPGTALMFAAFFCYCAAEQTAMLWASSYLVNHHSVEASSAASFASMFFIGMTAGRGLCGFVANKLGDKLLIRTGAIVMLVGIALVAVPVATPVPAIIGFVVTGFGAAPIYPSIIHSTPSNFGRQYSQSIIGLQMAFAYLGSTFMPPLFGVIAQYVDIVWLPLYLFVFTVSVLFLTEMLNRTVSRRSIAADVNIR